MGMVFLSVYFSLVLDLGGFSYIMDFFFVVSG